MIALLGGAVAASPPQTPAVKGSERAPHVQILPSAMRWSIPIPAPPPVGAVIADDKVLAVWPPDHLAAFRITDGVEVWKVELRPEQPLITANGRAYVSSESAIHAIRLEDGAVAWRRPSGALDAPLLVHEGWIIAATADSLVALRATDGSLVWQQSSAGQTERATIGGSMLYVPYSDGRVAAFDLLTGKPGWQRKLGGAASEILVADGRLYVGAADRLFYCLDADTGDLAWPPVRAGATPRGRAAIDARHVYFAGLDNMLRALDRHNGARRWQASLPFRPLAGPIIVGSVVLVPGPAAALSAFEAETGRPYAKIAFGASLLGPPVFAITEKGPVVAAVTGGLNEQWKLSVFEQSTRIELLPLAALPGRPGVLQTLPPMPSITCIPLKVLPGIAVPLPAVPGKT